MKKLKTAVVGLGRIGWKFHIPHITSHEGFELCAILDPLQERVDEGVEKFSVKGYTDFSKLIGNEQLDLIVIASPTPFHADQTIAAMEKGIDVFLEKPMASSLEEADRMIEASKKLNRKLMVYQPHRIASETRALKYIIEKDIIGPVYMIKRSVSRYQRRNDWQTQRKFGGGMLNNYGAHYIDQLLHVTGSKASDISCHLRSIATLGDADDVVKALIVTDNNIILDLDINMASAQDLTPCIIFGERGTAVLGKNENGDRAFSVKYYNNDDLKNLELKTELAAEDRSYGNNDEIPWRETQVLLSDFSSIDYYDRCYEYYAEDKEPYVPIEQTREVMRVIETCRKIGW